MTKFSFNWRWEADKPSQIHCPHCSGKAKKTIEELSKKFSDIGYTLIADDYISRDQKLGFICEYGHKHAMSWTDFQRGIRCTQCASYGFNLSIPAFCYYIEIPSIKFNKSFYKIGITNNRVQKRLSNLRVNYKIISVKSFDIGSDAYEYEQSIVSQFRCHIVPTEMAKAILPISGYTELFDSDVLSENMISISRNNQGCRENE